VTAPIVVILAAGQGTRMRSRVPKMLHEICGRPMIEWTVAAARESGAGSVVVVGSPDGVLDGRLPDGVLLTIQSEPNGTGGAVLAAADHLRGDGPVLVVNGDAPLVTPAALRALADAHAASGAAATIVTMLLDDPSSYGRVVRAPDGSVSRVVETKRPGDATADELAIPEVNAGVYAFERGRLLDALRRVGTDNAQGELYLPAALAVLRAGGGRVEALTIDDPSLLLGVNDRVELARVRKIAQRRIHDAHMRAGVTIIDPDTTTIDIGVRIGRDTVVEPSTHLRGATAIGEGCTIGPLTTAIDVVLGDDVTVVHSYLTGCEVRAGGTVGPFAYLRPGALLREGAKAGTFVEIKNSDIGEGTKVPHLSYVGDADVGPGTNLGAATITANYDGRRKHRTTIGANVRTSVDTTLVAPVTVGDDAYTGAGSVVTDDVPPGALAIARARQTNIEDYAERRREADRQPS
jgi:bifunctional UDP-N-acetylglucosamine pyrophosphorylase / glucosamine-1-phosphate N-acetyltransferase